MLLAAVLFPSLAAAQGFPSGDGAPKILTDPFGFIQEKLGIDIKDAVPGFSGEMPSPEEVSSGAPQVWENIKGWVQDHLGVDLGHFLRGIIDLLVWLFEFAIKLFKSAVDLL